MGELSHVVCVLPQSKFVLPAVVCEELHVGWELSHVVCVESHDGCELSHDGDEGAATGWELAHEVCGVPATVRACAADGCELLDDGRRRAPAGVELAHVVCEDDEARARDPPQGRGAVQPLNSCLFIAYASKAAERRSQCLGLRLAGRRPGVGLLH